MFTEEDLITVIEYYGQGQCRKCKTNLHVLESETNSILLSKNGLPVSSDNEYYNIRGYCTNCGEIYEMEKVGLHYRTKANLPSSYDSKEELETARLAYNPFSKE